ncbi:MAG: polymer-forming cytoskeletal protein [Syntrophobacterales bacterium]
MRKRVRLAADRPSGCRSAPHPFSLDLAMNVVGKGSMITGTIDCDNDVFISGHFEGTITTKGTLHVYPGGVVKGKVIAKNLTVAGSIHGEIEVSNRLRVKNSATLEANINTRFLDWEEGAKLDGEVRTFF